MQTKNPTRPYKVLIVEDDPDMCMFLYSLATKVDLPLEIQFASTVHEAVMWLDDGEPFDLVLADFLLSNSRNGYELRDVLADRSPSSHFAMMSSMPIQPPGSDSIPFLKKPFSPAEGREFIEARLTQEVSALEASN